MCRAAASTVETPVCKSAETLGKMQTTMRERSRAGAPRPSDNHHLPRARANADDQRSAPADVGRAWQCGPVDLSIARAATIHGTVPAPELRLRLADFIEANIEPILTEWVAFARTQFGAERMDLTALRDHAAEMLTEMVVDLRTPQTSEEQRLKSQGGSVRRKGSVPTAAESHGDGRAGGGFTVAEMMAEFRALRATVLRLWTARKGALSGTDLDDLTRFNEAIDQAIAESVARYTSKVDQSQDLFVAILGHDLRTPLHTITMVTEHVAEAGLLDAQSAPLMTRAVRSARRMSQMIDDLLDFTRSRMGVGIPIDPHDVDLQPLVEEAVGELRTGHAHHVFELVTTGDLRGSWDGPRIAQVLANLLGNAVQHGNASAPIQVSARGEAERVLISVRNEGAPISAEARAGLFSPFKRLQRSDRPANAQHLGLGLYIADQIVAAHGGSIDVASNEFDGTRFTVYLPRRARDVRLAPWNAHLAAATIP
jgi:signal transduction histidine kinase